MSHEKEILKKLDEVIALLKEDKHVMSFEKFCDYAGFSKSFGYKLTSANEISFYRPHGKMIYFEKSEVDQWLLKHRVRSRDEIMEDLNRK